MLPKARKVTASVFFKNKSQGVREKDNLFFYHCKFQDKSQDAKVLILVPKKVSKLATARNRARRVISEAIQTIYPSMKKHIHLSITAREALRSQSPQSIAPCIKETLEKMNILE